ncbi:MAG: porin family protein, partial [Alphaproteobacteria bacterium]|nr:porin family protein [Alphaproteobacteria bacterium]
MRLRTSLRGTAIGLGCAMSAASAVERHGWYVGLEAGWVHVNDTELPAWEYSEIQFENRWGALGTAGYAFDGNWRMEFEAGYRNNDVHSILNDGTLTFPADGELTEWTGFFN